MQLVKCCPLVIVIQSRASGELVWRDEVLRTNHFKAYMTAKAKARLTGRVYRLVDRDGVVLEQIFY
jgi:hypothetical protein